MSPESTTSEPTDRRARGAALALAAVAAGLFVAWTWNASLEDPRISPDGESYASVTRHLAGDAGPVSVLRLSRPVVPALALLWTPVIGPVPAFLVTNGVLFVALVGVFFGLARELLGSARGAFQACALLLCAFPVYYRGINVTVDMASWLFFVVVASVLLRRERDGRFTRGLAIALALACAAGTLVTELVLASLALVALEYARAHFRAKSLPALAGDLAWIGLAFGVPVLLYQLAFAHAVGFSLLENFQAKLGMAAEVPYSLGPGGLLRTLAATFSLALVLVVPGLRALRRDPRHARVLASMTIACVATLLAIYISSVRFAFVLFPVVFTLAVRGAHALAEACGGRRWVETASIGAVCAFNLLLYAAFVRFDTTDALARAWVPFLVD